MINVHNVHKYFYKNKNNEIHVLDEINIDLPSRGLVVLLGASGSGKTTLLNVLGGLDTVHSGTIAFNDYGSKKYSANVWNAIRRKEIGYVFQNYYLIQTKTVYDNLKVTLQMVGYTDEKMIQDRISYVLTSVGMFKYRNRFPSQLSGGQQQRVAIARALVKNAKVIIADEPTGNLDNANTIDVMNIIKNISQTRLVVLVTHDQNIAHFYADRIIELKDGKITSDQKNSPKESFSLSVDTDIYLKDFEHQSKTDHLVFYQNDSDINLKDLKLTLVYKNETLYIEVDSPIRKYILLNGQDQTKLIDAKAEKITHDSILSNQFDVPHSDYETDEKNLLFTFTYNFKNALSNLKNLGRKAKFMLSIFFLTGIIIALSASIIGNRFYNTEVFVDELKHYAVFNRPDYQFKYQDLAALKPSDDSKFYINPYGERLIRVAQPTLLNENAFYQLRGLFDIVDHLDKNNLIAGSMPKNDYEIVVDIRIYNNANGDYSTLGINGVWHYRDLIGESIIVNTRTFKIVGISDSNATRFYGTRAGMTLLYYSSGLNATSTISFDLLDEIVLTHGVMPNEGSGHVLIPNTLFGSTIPDDAFDNGGLLRINGAIASGAYDPTKIGFSATPMIGYTVDAENTIFNNSTGAKYIYSDHPNTIVDRLIELEYISDWPYHVSVLEAKTSATKLLPLLLISVIILLFSSVGTYYMTRTSMLSRHYEMSVYRALGVSKKRIVTSFVIENIVITLVSTFIGILLGSILIMFLQDKSSLNHIFYLNFNMVLLCIVFALVSSIGLSYFAIIKQLNKTPAQLLTNYDVV